MRNEKDKKILKEDIKDLKFLISKYMKEKKFEKVSECLKELKEFEKKAME